MSQLITSDLLRDQDDYIIEASFTNAQTTFRETDAMTFVPRQCSWFVADDSDALNGR